MSTGVQTFFWLVVQVILMFNQTTIMNFKEYPKG